MKLSVAYTHLSHHSGKSGYDQVVRYLAASAPVERLEAQMPRHVPWRAWQWAERRVASEWYDIWSLTIEAGAARRLIAGPETVHLLYGEDTYRHLGSLPLHARHRGARVVCTYHQPPAKLRNLLPSARKLAPTTLARIPERELCAFLEGCGYDPSIVSGDEPEPVHEQLAATLDTAVNRIRELQRAARSDGSAVDRPRWPMIVLRTPKGWTGPKVVDGLPVEGTFRSHQVPLAGLADNPEHLAALEAWMRSYRPEELFDENGALRAEIAALAPEGDRRMGASPHANGGRRLRPLDPGDRLSEALVRLVRPGDEPFQLIIVVQPPPFRQDRRGRLRRGL